MRHSKIVLTLTVISSLLVGFTLAKMTNKKPKVAGDLIIVYDEKNHGEMLLQINDSKSIKDMEKSGIGVFKVKTTYQKSSKQSLDA